METSTSAAHTTKKQKPKISSILSAFKSIELYKTVHVRKNSFTGSLVVFAPDISAKTAILSTNYHDRNKINMYAF